MMRRILLLVAVLCLGCNLSDPEANNANNQNNVNNENNENDGGDDATTEDMTPDLVVQEDMGVDAPVDMGPTPMAIEDFCEVRGLAYATELFICYSSGAYPQFYYDPAAPDAALQWGEECWFLQAFIDAGEVAYDPLEARRCADALEALDPDTCYFGDAPHRHLAECANVVTKLRQTGDDCYRYDSCIQGYCDQSSTCPGVCRDFAAPGEACDMIQCDYDVSNCTGGICVARGAAGTACATSSDCQSYTCLNNVCMNRVYYGEACDATNICAAGEVVGGTTVVQQCFNGVCELKSTAGGECLYDYGCPVGSWCERPDPAQLGQCNALPGLGQPCGNNYYCEAGLYCVANACEPAAQVNQVCGTGVGDARCDELARIYCSPSDNRCHEVGAQGDPCDPSRSDSCERGLICHASSSTCGVSLPQGARCVPYAVSYGVGYDAEILPTCQAGLGCRCDPAQPGCTQGNQNDPHLCQPYVSPLTECTRGSDCAVNEYCGPTQDGVVSCQPGTCQLR